MHPLVQGTGPFPRRGRGGLAGGPGIQPNSIVDRLKDRRARLKSRGRFSNSTSLRLEHKRNLPVLQTSESSFRGLTQGLRRGRLQPWLGNWSARLGLRKRHLPCVANVGPGLLIGPFHPLTNPSRRCLKTRMSLYWSGPKKSRRLHAPIRRSRASAGTAD